MSSEKWLFYFLLVCALGVLNATPALAHGDKVIPQVPDGTGTDGTQYRTKFDLINLGPYESYRITRVTLFFYRQDGNPWIIATNLGTASEFTFDLGPLQTIRIETQGGSSLTQGYAILRNLEKTTDYPVDYEVAMSVFYEIRKGGSIIDAVSIAVGQPTLWWVFPAEIDSARNLFTGFAVVNLTNSANSVTLRMRLATTPTSGTTQDLGSKTVSLAPREQKVFYLNDVNLFPTATSFRGMVSGGSDYAVAIIALLQSPSGTGVQYATMVPTYIDALRRNTYMLLRQGFPLDADIPIVDYTGNADNSDPWDLLYETQSTTTRRLVPKNGAQVAVVGLRSNSQFDTELNIEQLKQLTYTSNAIDMSNGSPNLTETMVIAVRTGMGRYVKMRVSDVIRREEGTNSYRDLGLEMYVYK